MNRIDLRNATYDDFIDFVFDHPVVRVPEDPTSEQSPWYWEVETQFHPMVMAGFYIRLFTESASLPAKFTDGQLEQGFWAIQSCNLDCGVSDLIWSPQVPFEVRESVVRSMFHLFEKLFSIKPLDTSANMWWDSLAYDWYCDIRVRANGGENLLMQDVMFETLQKIVHLPSSAVQAAALHGFGHLRHPETMPFIETWLQESDDVDTELAKYARAAARFEVM